MNWSLTESIETSAGMVAAGSAGAGEPLVLAHGWPWSSYSWHRLIPELSKHFKVHWYDMPGYGASEMHSGQSTSLDVQGKIFNDMLVHWNITNPIVVAHDFGGATTLRAHLLDGIEYNRYILLNVVAMRPWGSEFFDHVGKHVDAFNGLPPAIHKAIVAAYINGALISELDPTDVKSLVAPWLSAEGQVSFYSQFEQADEKYTADIESLYSKIRCPVKIIWGEDDPWIPLARGKALRDCVKPASFATLPGVGHLPQLEAPLETLYEILEFVQ